MRILCLDVDHQISRLGWALVDRASLGAKIISSGAIRMHGATDRQRRRNLRATASLLALAQDPDRIVCNTGEGEDEILALAADPELPAWPVGAIDPPAAALAAVTYVFRGQEYPDPVRLALSLALVVLSERE